MAYKKITQKTLTSLPAIRKRTAITQVAKPITVKKTSVSTTPVGRTNVGTQISGVTATGKPNATTIKKPVASSGPKETITATVIKKPTTGVQYVNTIPSTARPSVRTAIAKLKK